MVQMYSESKAVTLVGIHKLLGDEFVSYVSDFQSYKRNYPI